MKKIELKVNENDILKGLAWEIDCPTANVVIMQGMEEYGARYAKLAEFLNKNSINVYALDCYGQGLNVNADLSNASFWPEDGYFKQVNAYEAMVQEANKNGAKTYIFAHSMGSYMAQSYMQTFSGHVEKIVLCGSGSYNPGVKMGLVLANLIVNDNNRNKKATTLNDLMFGNFNKRIKQQRTKYDWLSYNEENVDKYIADPLCGFGPTNGFCFEFLKGMAPLYKKESLLKISKNQKIFIISGEEDPVTNYTKSSEALVKMYKKYGINNLSKKIYKNARHEILFEKCSDEVCEDVLKFFVE